MNEKRPRKKYEKKPTTKMYVNKNSPFDSLSLLSLLVFGGLQVSEWLLAPAPKPSGGDCKATKVGGGGDGLKTLLAGLQRHQGDVEVAAAVAGAMVRSARLELVASLLSVEFVVRLRDHTEGEYSRVVAHLLPHFVAHPKAAQELEWNGIVALLINYVLRDLRGIGAGGVEAGGACIRARRWGMRLLVETWRAFPRALIASSEAVHDILSALCLSMRGSARDDATCVTVTFRGACDLLLVMIQQKCSVAGQLYRWVVSKVCSPLHVP